jgi:hypothetical protein
VIYVPVYQPDQVYYDNSDGSPYITFGIGWPIGLWLDYDFDWGAGNLIVWDRDHPRPPIGGTNRRASATWVTRASGDPTIIPVQSRRTEATEVMARTRLRVRCRRRS